MSTYQEHPSKVTTWRNGELAGLDDSNQPDCTVWFAFGDDEEGPHWEGLLATRGVDDTAIVRSVPFFVYDLALGDTVRTVTSEEGSLVATERLSASGMLTFRVVFDGPDDDRWRRLTTDLARWSCWYDVRTPRFVAIAVDSNSAQDVAEYLQTRENAGELQYETGQSSA